MVQKKEPGKRPPPDFFLDDADQTPSKPITSMQYRANPTYHNSKAIVLDMGSSMLRAGYSGTLNPTLQLPPYVARTKDPQTGLRAFLVGYEALCSSARSTARPAYDAGIPNNPALMERLLDGTLAALGLGEEDHIRHKFVLTEAPCQPNSARALIMELLFEAYEAPGLCFGVDALFSYFYNRHRVAEDGELRYANDDAIILSCGYNASHVLPLVDGRLVPHAVKRVNVGGATMTNQFNQRLQLLHPEHSSVLTPTRVELLKERMCYVSNNYDAELTKIKLEPPYYDEVTKTVKVPTGEGSEKPTLSPEEQERLKQARIENGRRLSEMMREKRKAKNNAVKEKDPVAETDDIAFTEEEVAEFYDALKKLYDLQRISDMRGIDEDKYYIAMCVHKFESSGSLTEEMDRRQARLKSEREKLGEAKAAAAEAAWWKRVHDDELLSMSDSELSAAELKHKRHVRAMRGAAEARIRAKRAKEAEKKAEERKAAEIRKMREEKPEEYLALLRSERDQLADKLKQRTAAREAGSDRRSQAARERMRLLAQHAGNKAGFDDGPPGGSGKGRGRITKGRGKGRGRGRGRGGTRGKKGRGGGDDDTFGMNDSDWDVYKSMKVGNGGSDSDDNSSEERERLKKVRQEISELAPDETDPTMSIPEGAALLFEENEHNDEFPVTIDRLRTGEIAFQPTLAGVEQCGIVEALQMSVDSVDRSQIVREVFLTGGVSRMRGLRDRVCSDLRMRFPTEWGDAIVRGVGVSSNATLDAWRGAAMFAERGGVRFDNACITKAQFEEMGNGYLREHWFSNVFFPTPILSAADLELKKKMQKQAGKRGRPKSFV